MDVQLQGRLISHEEANFYHILTHSVYQDTKGYWTIDPGICVDKRLGCGLTTEECLYLFNNRVDIFVKELEKYPWFNNQDDVRKGVLIELAYTMGIEGLLTFHQMLQDIENKKYGLAYIELMGSKWAQDVKIERASDVGIRLKTGQY